MTKQNEEKLPSVRRAKQERAANDPLWWAARCVWTDNMLNALREGVKGGFWFSLIDKVYAPNNLSAAFAQVASNRGNAGVDHVSIDHYAENVTENLADLHSRLKDGTYRPHAILRVYIPKAGTKEQRPLGIPTVEDRIVQTAVLNVIEPIFDLNFSEHSYGFRHGFGAKDALRRVDTLLKENVTFVVDADLKSYFDSIPHEVIMSRVKERIADGRVLELIEMFLKQPINDKGNLIYPELGTPQGAVISPLLSNLVLDPLDKIMSQGGFQMTRYADDFVIQCRSEAQAIEALEIVKEWVSKTGLTLHPTKTHIVDYAKGGSFDFLGYHFENGKRYPRAKSMKKLKDTMRAKTRRNNRLSLDFIIPDLNVTLKGWFEYFKHSCRYTFSYLDGFIRRRLRSILRREKKKKGGTGRCYNDHKLWPNKFFHDQGLFSLMTAFEQAINPPTR